MTSLTYTGPAAALAEAFEILEETGALKPRELPSSPALVSMRDATLRLWRNWDDREADLVAANNLFFDTPADVRRRGIEKVKTEMGECKRSRPQATAVPQVPFCASAGIALRAHLTSIPIFPGQPYPLSAGIKLYVVQFLRRLPILAC